MSTLMKNKNEKTKNSTIFTLKQINELWGTIQILHELTRKLLNLKEN